MKRAISGVLLLVVTALMVAVAAAGLPTVAGRWTVSVETLALRLVLAQDGRAVSGTLDYPHGAAFQLTGTFADDSLTSSGDSAGPNFKVHIELKGSLNADGTLVGTINAHYIEFDDAQQVVRTRDQEMKWTAVRAGAD